MDFDRDVRGDGDYLPRCVFVDYLAELMNDSKTITCKDCGDDFQLTAGEQEFYKSRDLFEPKRCQSCRKAKKDRQSNN